VPLAGVCAALLPTAAAGLLDGMFGNTREITAPVLRIFLLEQIFPLILDRLINPGGAWGGEALVSRRYRGGIVSFLVHDALGLASGQSKDRQ
jgi:hypothetical protein